MHDLDRTQLEYNSEFENYEFEQSEFEQNNYGEFEWETETGIFSEAENMELATELLEINSEFELDRFLGGLIKKAGKAIGKNIKSQVGQQVGGLLKGAAKKALPHVTKAIDGYAGGSFGGQLGSQVASTASQIFGLELEGLSQEDQEFEAAKSFVQFAGEVAKNAASASPAANPAAVAKSAAVAAARQLAPGLVGGGSAPSTRGATPSTCPTCGNRAGSGRWIRRGNKIVLYGA